MTWVPYDLVGDTICLRYDYDLTIEWVVPHVENNQTVRKANKSSTFRRYWITYYSVPISSPDFRCKPNNRNSKYPYVNAITDDEHSDCACKKMESGKTFTKHLICTFDFQRSIKVWTQDKPKILLEESLRILSSFTTKKWGVKRWLQPLCYTTHVSLTEDWLQWILMTFKVTQGYHLLFQSKVRVILINCDNQAKLYRWRAS